MTFAAALLATALAAQTTPARRIAITFDDIPTTSVLPQIIAARESLTVELLDAIVAHRVPAIGFVNEVKLADSSGAIDARMTDLLSRWLEAGLALGNHTYSHPDLHTTPRAEFEADLVRGETVTRRLLEARGLRLQFFRHPFLHTGRDLATRDSLVAFLSRRGERVAPVTVDNSDYTFAAAYDRLRRQGDTAATRRIASTYLDYMESVVAFYEAQSTAILGRELPQILLLHANRLNAETFDLLARRLERRGYRFISLEQALADEAYRSADLYTGPAGITWLHRWAITRGMPGSTFRGEPEVPDWVESAAR